MPRGMVIGFKVIDPRLQYVYRTFLYLTTYYNIESFPPKNAKPEINKSGHLRAPPITLPSSQLANSEIWDADIRSKLSKPRYKKKDIDDRKSKVSTLMRFIPFCLIDHCIIRMKYLAPYCKLLAKMIGSRYSSSSVHLKT